MEEKDIINEENKEPKKVKKGRKILKVIALILLILIVLFLLYIFRNYIIITKMHSKVSKYVQSNNYNMKSISTEADGTTVKVDYYTKDEKQVVFLERNKDGNITKLKMYNNGQGIDTFVESDNKKTLQLNSSSGLTVQICDYFQLDNTWQTILASATACIRNEKDCYRVDNFWSTNYLYGVDKNEVYIEKDTGLVVKSNIDDSVNERKYEFDNVADSIFVEPDISQYTIIE